MLLHQYTSVPVRVLKTAFACKLVAYFMQYNLSLTKSRLSQSRSSPPFT
jgi:hypothetical protein